MIPDVNSKAHLNRVHAMWKPTPEYFNSPWDYYVRFIRICQDRHVRFITMSQALCNEYDPTEINVLLDHHIDYYPVETQTMCAWEIDNDVVSNVYLFNYSPYLNRGQRNTWSIEDLDIAFYQKLEKNGFEIGYHQNAVGIVETRTSYLDRSYKKKLNPDTLKSAQDQFATDIESLRRFFNIRTFIPHGAGEGNSSLIELPGGYEDLVWVYNNARKNKTIKTPIKWKNYSDSCGQSPQRIRSSGGQYIVRRNNLIMAAWALEPGLNHVLTHPGRYGKGMPYELYQGPEFDSSYTSVSNEWIFDSDARKLPVSITATEPSSSPTPILKSLFTGFYKLIYGFIKKLFPINKNGAHGTQAFDMVITDQGTILYDWLSRSAEEIPLYVHHRKLSKEERSRVVVERPIKRDFAIPEKLNQGNADTGFNKEQFFKEYENFFNILYSDDLISHLFRMEYVPRKIHISDMKVTSTETATLLVKLLKRYRKKCTVYMRVVGQMDVQSKWVTQFEKEWNTEPQLQRDYRYELHFTPETSTTFDLVIKSIHGP